MKFTQYLLVCPAIALVVQLCAAQEAKGCKDSPLITRFPGSVITYCEDKQDDVVTMSLPGSSKKIEGEIHKVTYRYPKASSKQEVIRNMRTALQQAGYTIDWDTGTSGDLTAHMGKTWIYEGISVNGDYQQTIAVEIALTQEVVATAAALTSGLAATGHTVVNRILFDTAKADVKPESAAALEEVVKLLKEDPKLKVFVVGHTDNVGATPANLDLSRRRAAAVVQILTAKYAVAADRLQSYGAGPYAPRASNDTEDGPTLNRRVELVKQ
jgi:outer membrane protein OmpA-like peptidoglycan-associated protein